MRLLLSFVLATFATAATACTIESTPTPSPSPSSSSTTKPGDKTPGNTSSTTDPEENTDPTEPTDPGGDCTAPSISGSKALGNLTSTEKGKLCDYNACPFGGYGKSKTCSNGTTVKSKSSQSTCQSDATWSKCADLSVSDYFSCVDAVNADPCQSLTIITSDPACAAFKDCAF